MRTTKNENHKGHNENDPRVLFVFFVFFVVDCVRCGSVFVPAAVVVTESCSNVLRIPGHKA
jgi:hypothetical protein